MSSREKELIALRQTATLWKWVTANEENSPELVKSFARDIRILAENRIEEIENEKVSSCCRSSGESSCSCRD